MSRLFRDGYWRDIVVLLVITVILGSGAAWGIALAFDSFFGDAVSGIIGDAGEYDVLIQVRNQQGEAAENDLEQAVDRHLPGASLKAGVSLAGQTVYFLKIPPQFRTADTFENLSSMFQNVSGFIGHSLLVEPSIVVNGIHEAIAKDAKDLADSMSEVDFTFRNGSNLVVVLKRADGIARVQERLESFLNEREVVEVRWPLGASLPDRPDITATVEQTLRSVWGDDAIDGSHQALQNPDTETFVTTLTEMRRFLLGYATRIVVPGNEELVGRRIVLRSTYGDAQNAIDVQVEGLTEEGASVWGYAVNGSPTEGQGPWTAYAYEADGTSDRVLGEATVTNERGALQATLDESVRLLSNLSDFAGEARQSVHQADAILAAFDEAVGQLHTLDEQIRQLEQGLVDLGGQGEATPTQALLSVLISGWLNRLSGGAPEDPTDEVSSRLLQLDLPAIEQTLQMLADGVTELAELDVDAVIFQIEQIQRTLPMLDDEEIARSVRLIDENLGGSAIPGDRLTLLTKPGVPLGPAEQALTKALEIPGIHLVQTAAGVIAPNARMALSQILGQVRELIAALLSLAVVLLTLFLDHSVLLCMERVLGSKEPKGRRHRYAPALLGAGLGAVLLLCIALLSGGRIPVLGWWGLLVLGGSFGLITALLAERISPIDWDEVVAGEALGLTHAQIMREIVVPSARPGLLTLLNRWHQQFR